MLRIKLGKYHSRHHTFLFVFNEDPSKLFNCKFFAIDVIEPDNMYRLRPAKLDDKTRNAITYNKKAASFAWQLHYTGDESAQNHLATISDFARTDIEYEVDSTGINFVIPSVTERLTPQKGRGRRRDTETPSKKLITKKLTPVKPNVRELSTHVGNSKMNIRSTIQLLNDQIQALDEVGIKVKILFNTEDSTVSAKINGEI